jgi:dihydrofolate reductase
LGDYVFIHSEKRFIQKIDEDQLGNLNAFVFLTLNGYYKGPNEDISWNVHDAEENQYSVEMLKSGNTLLFGRVTYELMASYWS